ncbi:hypothetical protein PF008_g2572 [Phytophthora fragariae]|uniref:Uncharacterized protein n=1 Tax=Phytophthora fragariae TaxID=53985 RepID=A0A6G0SGY3_9STRA|nr:hypothetical protein PF008_g2572 [Phytophthora fragariae]
MFRCIVSLTCNTLSWTLRASPTRRQHMGSKPQNNMEKPSFGKVLVPRFSSNSDATFRWSFICCPV